MVTLPAAAPARKAAQQHDQHENRRDEQQLDEPLHDEPTTPSEAAVEDTAQSRPHAAKENAGDYVPAHSEAASLRSGE